MNEQGQQQESSSSRKKQHQKQLGESRLLSRSTMYTSLESIDQGNTSTSGFVKAAGRKRLVDWYQDISAEFHAAKPRLDGKGNGAMPARTETSSLEQRGLMIGKKDFRAKRRKQAKRDNNNSATTLRFKTQQRIYRRLLRSKPPCAVDSTAAGASDGDATRKYMLHLTKCWQQYFYQATTQKHSNKKQSPNTDYSRVCWIGAPLRHGCNKHGAILCGETRNAWCLFRLDSATVVHMAKTSPLTVVLPNEGTTFRINVV